MQKLWYGLLIVGGVLVAAILGIGFASDAVINARSDAPLPVIRASSGPDAVARGAHLGRIYGCDGCHERNLQGSLFFADPVIGSVHSANLTQALPHYSDARLARAIREGVRADGSVLWGMPSESWVEATDAEVSDLIVWLRTHPAAGEEQPRIQPTFLGRIALLMKKFEPSAAYVAEARAKQSFDAGPQFAQGRHLAATVCSECHRSDLKGDGMGSPDLMIAASYDLPGFTHLMRTGIGQDGKEHGLMTAAAKGRFAFMTDDEIKALHAYLVKRAEDAS